MKKTFLVALLAIFTMSASAQLMTSRMSKMTGERKTHVWMDFGVGLPTGDASKAKLGAAVDLGFRITHMYTENYGWDIVRIKGKTYCGADDIGDVISVGIQTGFRYVSPVLFSNKTLYGNVMLGASAIGLSRSSHHSDDDDAGFSGTDAGFDWEIGAGINLTKHFSAGLFYESQSATNHGYSYNWGMFGLRGSLRF